MTSQQANEIAIALQKGLSQREIAETLGTSRRSVQRTIAQLARAPKRARNASEFTNIAPRITHPQASRKSFSWDLESIRKARDAQVKGDFKLPSQLATAFRTDSALFTAIQNRVAPQSVIASRLVPHESSRGQAIASKALSLLTIPRATIASLTSTFVDHGIAIGYIEHTPNATGTAIAMRLTVWPLEHVYYDDADRCLKTHVHGGQAPVPISHGDGRWVVVSRFDNKPWCQDACLIPASFVWAAHAGALSDWSASTHAHGLAQLVGELPEGTALLDGEGNLSSEAQAFLTLLQDLVSGEASAGLRPAGSKTDYVANGSNAWQVFDTLAANREKAAARIYLGTDAMLGSVGGAPGVDISTLFGVATTKLQADLGAIELALNSGMIQPWTAIHVGTSSAAPTFKYQLPDPDMDAKGLQIETAHSRLHKILSLMRDNQMQVDQATVNALAGSLGISAPPQLAAIGAQKISIQLAPTDVATVVTVDEARNSQGLPPIGGDTGNMFLSELKAQAAASPEEENPA